MKNFLAALFLLLAINTVSASEKDFKTPVNSDYTITNEFTFTESSIDFIDGNLYYDNILILDNVNSDLGINCKAINVIVTAVLTMFNDELCLTEEQIAAIGNAAEAICDIIQTFSE